jgi:hypothetical protein
MPGFYLASPGALRPPTSPLRPVLQGRRERQFELKFLCQDDAISCLSRAAYARPVRQAQIVERFHFNAAAVVKASNLRMCEGQKRMCEGQKNYL